MSWTPARAGAAAVRALSRTAAYLGPLFVAAGLYLCRLCLDAIDRSRVMLLRRRARRAPSLAAACTDREQQIRQAGAARWADWQALPGRRRAAIRAAAGAAALVAVLAVRSPWPVVVHPEPPAADAYPTSPIQPGAAMTSPAQIVPAIDLESAAARFQRDSARADAGEWVFLTEGAVLAPGPQGAWDDFSAASPWVLRHSPGGGGGYRMWYRGCSPRGRDHGCAIGHAASVDGIRWTKTAGPVFQPVDTESRQLHAVAVAQKGGGYFLWYSWVPALFGSRKVSSLHLATSEDGLRWEDAGEVLTASEHVPYPIEPSVLEDNGVFHLWYVDSLRHFEKEDFGETAGAPFLMHFTSADGRRWKEAGGFPLGANNVGRVRVTVERRADAEFHATFFERLGGRWGRLTSADGSAWELDRSSVTRIDAARASFGDGGASVSGATSLGHDGGALVWFVAKHRGGREEIRAGFRKGD